VKYRIIEEDRASETVTVDDYNDPISGIGGGPFDGSSYPAHLLADSGQIINWRYVRRLEPVGKTVAPEVCDFRYPIPGRPVWGCDLPYAHNGAIHHDPARNRSWTIGDQGLVTLPTQGASGRPETITEQREQPRGQCNALPHRPHRDDCPEPRWDNSHG
jgi:hypothetical protein